MVRTPHPVPAPSARAARGFSIAEMLVVVVIIGIAARAVVPLLGITDTTLEVAGQEVGNAVRFAVSEAGRTGGYILVDAGTKAGHVLVVNSTVTAARGSDVLDPLTKRALDIDVTGSAFSKDVKVNAKFVTSSGTYSQLLIGPGPAFWGAQSSTVMGTLQNNSGIDLTIGGRTATVAFDEVTGRVSVP